MGSCEGLFLPISKQRDEFGSFHDFRQGSTFPLKVVPEITLVLSSISLLFVDSKVVSTNTLFGVLVAVQSWHLLRLSISSLNHGRGRFGVSITEGIRNLYAARSACCGFRSCVRHARASLSHSPLLHADLHAGKYLRNQKNHSYYRRQCFGKFRALGKKKKKKIQWEVTIMPCSSLLMVR